ncbi:MAG: N-acetylmuramoyl-L-alanine amidase [Bacteroidales bacterium]|jgi:N-acetylmuramoyl-L-alanine amidase|nr:N-acetylmuramoyl-L-alanine amidase [Bacteroidales bacterium]
MKVLYAATVLCTYLLLSGINTPSLANDSLPKIKVVVIDAGHGGHDPGAIGITGVQEKNITLAIALKLGYMIEKNTEVKVIYTRKTDVFVELKTRTQIANNNHADMFISIHCNSVENNSAANRAESYVMGVDKNTANLTIAQKENSAILSEKNHESDYGGYDPNSTEDYIILSMYQNKFLDKSAILAKEIQAEFQAIGRQVREVQQAGFLVLWRAAMPSVLIETGFLSNKEEEAYLASEKGQTEMALAIYNGLAKEAHLPTMNMQDVKNLANKKPATTTSSTSNNQSSGVVYKVQICALQEKLEKKELEKRDPKLKNITQIEVEKAGDKLYRYFTGHCATYAEAEEVLTSVMKKTGYKAEIVAYKNGTRITLQEAKELENK